MTHGWLPERPTDFPEAWISETAAGLLLAEKAGDTLDNPNARAHSADLFVWTQNGLLFGYQCSGAYWWRRIDLERLDRVDLRERAANLVTLRRLAGRGDDWGGHLAHLVDTFSSSGHAQLRAVVSIKSTWQREEAVAWLKGRPEPSARGIAASVVSYLPGVRSAMLRDRSPGVVALDVRLSWWTWLLLWRRRRIRHDALALARSLAPATILIEEA